jgi:hypothetical protein
MFIFAYIIAIFVIHFLPGIFISITTHTCARIGHIVVLEGGYEDALRKGR